MVGALILSVATIGLTGLFNRPEGAYRSEIGSAIETWWVSAGSTDQLLLTDITPFAWDRAVVFEAYVRDDDTDGPLGFRWHIQDEYAAVRDGTNVLAFALGDHVVAWTDVASMGLPVGDEGVGYSMTRSDARLVGGIQCPWQPICAAQAP